MSTALSEARSRQRELVQSFENIARARQVDSPVDLSSLMGGTGQSTFNHAILQGDSGRARTAYSLFRDWTYTAITFLAKRVSSLPWNAGEIENAEENPERRTISRFGRKSMEAIPDFLRQRAVTDQQLNVIASHPSLDILCRPNSVQGKFEFLYMTITNLLITGEAYWLGGVFGQGDGDEIELWAVPTSCIRPDHRQGLFANYFLQINDATQPLPIDGSLVQRIYIPDPTDIKASFSPVRGILRAIKSDDRMQETQLRSLSEGLDPKIVVGIGKVRGPDGKMTDRRPVLTGAQRRQIIRAVREVMSRSLAGNEPAIVDGMIESITKLSATPAELDFPGSGAIIKARIMQAFGVNPIVLGEIVGANRAQAVVADDSVNDNAVNPLANKCSEAMTEFVGPMFDSPERLILWLDRAVARDPAQVLAEWTAARQNGDATRDEYRSEILGLPPAEKHTPADVLQNLPSITGLLQAAGRQEITPEQVASILKLGGFDQSDAEDMAGLGDNTSILPEGPGAPPLAIEDQTETDSIDATAIKSRLIDASHEKKNPAGSIRKAIRELHVKQLARGERELQRTLAVHFRQSVSEAVASLLQLEIEFTPNEAAAQAASLIGQIFDVANSQREVAKRAFLPLAKSFAEGAITELEANAAVTKQVTTAEEIAANLEIELPAQLALQMPPWMIENAKQAISETFQQPYWLDIPRTTANDIQATLQRAISEGLSTRRAARLIADQHGAMYSMIRAMRVARTEIPNANNAGHAASIEHVAQETGLDIRKMWLSVNGPTTREDHSNADGQLADDDGMFTVGGERAPWPAHFSLSAHQRLHCQCTTISSAI